LTYPHVEDAYGHVHRETGEVKRTLGADDDRSEWSWQRYDHVTERVIMVDDPNRSDISKLPAHHQRDWSGDSDPNRYYAHKGEDGMWRWVTRRHWLGDALIIATAEPRFGGKRRTRYFLSS